MVLESTMICVDNSDYMRNGDFLPTRLQAQQDAVSLVCHSKTRSNPENNVGLLTLANTEVLATLTADTGKILSTLHQVQPKGSINLITGIRIAHLVLKHRQGKHHKMRIVLFVGSPVQVDEAEVTKLGKRLKKEKVSIDVINFGEESVNTDILCSLINCVNGKDGTGNHLVTIPAGPHLSDALISSPIIQGEDGAGGAGLGTGGFEFGIDPNEDPELALALRVSMEEQRHRQEEESRAAREASLNEGGASSAGGTAVSSAGSGGAGAMDHDGSEDALLEKALAMSLEAGGSDSKSNSERGTTGVSSASSDFHMPDFSQMTEEQQIAYALQMSMSDAGAIDQPSEKEKENLNVPEKDVEEPMDTSDPTADATATAGDRGVSSAVDDAIADPAFLQSVLQSLPGVDPESEAIRSAVGAMTRERDGRDAKNKKDDKKDENK